MHLSCCYILMFSGCCSFSISSCAPSLLHSHTLSFCFFFPSLFNLLNLPSHLALSFTFSHYLSFHFFLQTFPLSLNSHLPCFSKHKHQSVTRRSFSHSFHTDSSVLTKSKSRLPLQRRAPRPYPKVMLPFSTSLPLVCSLLIRLSRAMYTVRSWLAVDCGK